MFSHPLFLVQHPYQHLTPYVLFRFLDGPVGGLLVFGSILLQTNTFDPIKVAVIQCECDMDFAGQAYGYWFQRIQRVGP